MNDAEFIAQQFLEDLGINSYPIDPLTICKQLGIHVFKENFDGLEGVLLFNGKKAAIGLNRNQGLYTREKFSVAHELGHFAMDIKFGTEQVFKCTKSMIENFDKSKEIELRADRFASELLLPSNHVNSLLKNHDPSWTLIKDVATKFEVSLLPAAIKFINHTSKSCCIVISKDNKILFYRPSKEFRYGMQMDSRILSENCFAYNTMNGNSIPDHFETIAADNWISGRKVTKDSEIYEWSLPLNSYGVVMTLLWDDGLVESDEDSSPTEIHSGGDGLGNYSYGGVNNFPWEPPSFHKKKR